jgi:hypothetical protein
VIRCVTAFFPQPVVLCLAKGFEGSEVRPFDTLTIAVHFGFVMSFQDYEGYRIVVGETLDSASLAPLLEPLEVTAQNRSLDAAGSEKTPVAIRYYFDEHFLGWADRRVVADEGVPEFGVGDGILIRQDGSFSGHTVL